MILLLLAYIGGVLTILSPCILPVLPFVFARSGQPFARSGLPLLLGMAITFALVATLAAVGGGWAVQANQYGRDAALLLLALFGLTLLFPALSDHLTRPLVALGNRLSESAQGQPGTQPATIIPSLLLGVATGLLWAPCAGPILGLLLTGAALEGASGHTTLLLFAYALGAATSLAGALLIGGKLFAAMKRSLGAGEWIRRGLGVAVIAGVVAIALGLDTGLLTRLSQNRTASLEQALLDKAQPANASSGAMMSANAAMTGSNAMMAATTHVNDAMNGAMLNTSAAANNATAASENTLPVEGTLPSLSGAVQWLNSPPLTAEGLRGKVVLVDFWTYSCINCLRTLPYIQAWADKYRDQGLVVIGVHAPEFAFEKNIDHVRQALKDLHVTYPVAIDNNYAIWRGFNNQYWPAHYFIDAQGRIRHHHFGEGEYDESERVIQQLLAEAGHPQAVGALAQVQGQGVSLAPDDDDTQSPETYVGYARAENFAGPGEEVHNATHDYTAPAALTQNQWGLAGVWKVGDEKAVGSAGGHVVYRFHARDLHLVLGPSIQGKPVHFRVHLDGAAPGTNHGMDTDANGNGVITGQRLYQLIRQQQPVQDRTFDIEFLDPGAQVFSFTFG